jgi:hypothetical protein
MSEAVRQAILKDDVAYPDHFSPNLVNLLQHLFVKSGLTRCSVEDIVDHPFFGDIKSFPKQLVAHHSGPPTEIIDKF